MGELIHISSPSERLGDLAYWRESFQKTTIQDVETYLGLQCWDQQDTIMRLAHQFHREEQPLANTASLIPVAAHQESERILPAIAQFARQKTEEPFSVLLYLNAPADADSNAIEQTQKAVIHAQEQYPNLDLRVSEVQRLKNPTIGRIRKNLWDASLYLAYYDGLFENDGDIVGINNDIDIESMGQGYVRHVQNHYAKRKKYRKIANSRLKPAGTQVRHAYDPKRPNISKVVRWYDLACRIHSPESAYEAGIAIPLSAYARSGGMRPNDTTHETSSILHSSGLSPRIAHTSMAVSPRRFGERLHDVELGNVYTDDSFSADDLCRTKDLRDDISEERAKYLITDSFEEQMSWFFHKPIADYESRYWHLDLKTSLEKRKRLAVTVLARLDPSGELAAHIQHAYSVEKMHEELTGGSYPSILTRQ